MNTVTMHFSLVVHVLYSDSTHIVPLEKVKKIIPEINAGFLGQNSKYVRNEY